MKRLSFFSPEHAIARYRAVSAADATGRPRVIFSDPSTRPSPPSLLQRLCRLFR